MSSEQCYCGVAALYVAGIAENNDDEESSMKFIRLPSTRWTSKRRETVKSGESTVQSGVRSRVDSGSKSRLFGC
jgi:hypothetical protein